MIDVAKASGSVAPGVAQDVDDATQLLLPVLDGRLDEAVARYDRPRGAASARPARAAADLRPTPYDELDAIDEPDGTDDLDELDAIDEPDDVEIDLREHAGLAGGPDDRGGAGATGGNGEPRALESPLPEPVAWRSAP